MRSLTAVLTAALVLLPTTPAWAANTAPVVVDDAVSYRNTGRIEYAVNALANDSDPDGDTLTYTAVTPASKGNAFLSGGRLWYKPYFGNTGTDSFTYTVTDGQGNTATGTVTATLWVDLPAPAELTISSAAAGSATVTWSAVPDAVKYQVFMNNTLHHTTSSLTWTNSGLFDGQYQYRVAAVNGGGWAGGQSAPVYRQQRPPIPYDLATEPNDDPTAVTLTWYGIGFSGPWLVYRDGAPVGTTSEERFRESGLTTGREYRYEVQAVGTSTSTSYTPPSDLSGVVRAIPAAITPIGQLFREMGGSQGSLGPVTDPERSISGGRQQDHRSGMIVQQDGADPYALSWSFADAYRAAGGSSGDLGFPTEDLECGLRDYGCVQLFEGGSIWRSAYTLTARSIRPIIEDGWAASGWEEGPLGYPVGDQVALPGGVAQAFEGGAVYWSAATGSHGVSGAIGELWASAEGTDGRFGYPTTDERCGLRDDGCFQRFQGGSVYWSPTTGAHPVGGAIGGTWVRQGAENGGLGYPTSGENCGLRAGGCWQGFQGGTIHWSPATGAHVTTGAIRNTWARSGWENGGLGYPTTGENCGLRAGGCWQGFQGGTIHWSPATGAQVTTGAIRNTWARSGWENGGLGYPTSGENCGLRGGGCSQRFQGGSIYWSPASGAHIVSGAVRDAWARQKSEIGRLGYPVTGETFSGGAYRQTFQGGTITMPVSTWVAQISYR